MKTKKYELSPAAKDALTEVASVGSGNASSALSNLIGKEVNLVTPSVNVIHVSEIPKLVGGPKKMVVAVYTPIAGDLEGNMMVVFVQKSALNLVDLMQKQKIGTTNQMGKKEQKLLNQVMHALSTTYLNAMGEFLGITTSQANPRFIATFGSSITDFALFGIEEKPNYIVLLKTNFIVEPDIEGNFIMLLAVSSIDMFVELIKKKVGEA